MKYILYTGSGIGDMAIILPMARRIKLHDKNAYIMAFSRNNKKRFKAVREILALQKWIDEAIYYSIEEPWQDVKLMYSLGIKQYDYAIKIACVDAQHISKWPNRIMNVASQKIVGMNLPFIKDINYDYSIDFCKEESVYNQSLKLLETIGISEFANEQAYPIFDFNKIVLNSNISSVLSDDKKKIILLPGCMPWEVITQGKRVAKMSKKWDYIYWFALGDKLVEDGYCVVMLGGKKEKIEMEGMDNKLNNQIINLCGETSLSESLAIIGHSDLIVGSDTGLMHCANAIGTPSLTLFGCTDYRKYINPVPTAFYIQSIESCSPCCGTDKLIDCNDFKCMRSITVEMVYQKVLEILDGVQAKKYENKTDF